MSAVKKLEPGLLDDDVLDVADQGFLLPPPSSFLNEVPNIHINFF